MSDQPKPTGRKRHRVGGGQAEQRCLRCGATHRVGSPHQCQPKPTGEWTTIKLRDIYIKGGESMQPIADAINAELAAEQKAGQELIKMHREAVDVCNKERDKLADARKLLFAVHPFCEAWGVFDLAGDIKDFLDGKPRKEEHEKEKGSSDGSNP